MSLHLIDEPILLSVKQLPIANHDCFYTILTMQVYNKPYGQYFMGIFYGGHGQLLLCQFISVVVIVGWVVSET